MKTISTVLVLLLVLVGCGKQPVEPKPDPTPQRSTLVFTVGGHEYTMPVPFSEFKANGWELEDDESFMIPAQSFLENLGIRKDKFYLVTTFYNNSDISIPLKDALVVNIQAENRYVNGHYKDDLPPDIVLQEVIKWNLEEADAKAFYNMEPRYEENRAYRSYIYEFEDGQVLTLQYHIEENRLKYIRLLDFGKGPQAD